MNSDELKNQFNAMQSGDKQAFAAIYNELKTPVFTIIYRITGDKTMSEDCLHDVFVKLFCSTPDCQVNNPRAWIFKVARNQALDFMRKPIQSELPEEIEEKKEPIENSIGLKLDVQTALKQLPDDSAQIVILHLNGDLKFKEIADILGFPIGTVFWKYQKAITAMRTYLNGGVS